MTDRNLYSSLTDRQFQEIHDAGERFEQAIQNGDKICIEQWITGASEQVQVALFRELFAIELESQTPDGRTRLIDDYRSRFPDRDHDIEQVVAEVSQDRQRHENLNENNAIAPPELSEIPDRDSDSRYHLEREIARGGVGIILKGRDTELGRDLAIKVLLEKHANNPQLTRRFIEEAQIGGQLQHPGIAPVYELGRFSNNRLFFSMKLVKGQTLLKLLTDREDSAEDRSRFIAIFEQVCQTMAYTHSRGVIHRDLKPVNIMVGAFGEVQVMDWGLAKVLSRDMGAKQAKSQTKEDITNILTRRLVAYGDSANSHGESSADTSMGSVMGTPAYMPPEQALGEIDRLDERSDVFCLGAILCEILTGKPPYVGDEIKSTYRLACRARLSDCYARLDACGADSDLIALTKECLQSDHDARPRNAAVLAERVSGYMASVEAKLKEQQLANVDAQVRSEEFNRRSRLVFMAGAAILASLVIGIAGSVLQAVRADQEAVRARSAENTALLALDELRSTAPAFAEQARTLAAKELFDQAIEKLDYAMKLRPDVPEYLVAKADLLQSQLRLAEAATAYRNALRLQPGLERVEESAKLCDELLAGGVLDNGILPRESLAKLHVAMQEQQRPASELILVARLLGEEKRHLVEYWLARLRDLPVSSEYPLERRLLLRDDGRLALDLSDTKINDLSPLSGAPLAALTVARSHHLVDLSPLRGLKLVELDISDTGVADLGPLSEMQTLEGLEISGSRITDLSALRSLHIKRLGLQGCPISDLAPIEKMELEEINLRQTRVTDLSPLVGMPVKNIDVGQTPVTDFSPLAELPLEKCYLDGNRIIDLSVLRGKPLKELVLWGCNAARRFEVLADIQTLELLLLPSQYRTLPQEDYEAIGLLRRLPKLRQLGTEYFGAMGFSGAGVIRAADQFAEDDGRDRYFATQSKDEFWEDWDREQAFLPALRKSGFNFSLTKKPNDLYCLKMRHQAISDLSIIRDAPLCELWLISCQVRDLTPIHGMPLEILNVCYNPVVELAPLRGMPLTRLFLSGTQVTDLSPLVSLPLEDLYLDNCKNMVDVEPLVGISTLENLLVPAKVKNLEQLRNVRNLRRVGFTLVGDVPMLPETTAEEFWQSFEDQKWLRDLMESGLTFDSPRRFVDGTWDVNLDSSEIRELSLLSNAPISRLSVSYSDVSDLSPLRGMKLKSFRCINTKVEDLSPLQEMPLEELSLRGTPVSDITALRGLPLRSLLMCNCKNLIDLSPLSDCQTLQSITLPPRAQDIECLRDLSQLERISFREVSRPPFGPDMTAEEFWREYDANRNRP